MSSKMTVEDFMASLETFGMKQKEQWDLATKMAVSAILFYREDNDPSLVAKLHEKFTWGNGTFAQCFEKLVWKTTNLRFNQDEGDLQKAVTVAPKGDNPKEYVSSIDLTEKEGLACWGSAAKSKRRATKLNRNGAAPVKSIKTDANDPTKGKELTPEQQALAKKVEEKREADLKAILDGTYTEEDTTPKDTDTPSEDGTTPTTNAPSAGGITIQFEDTQRQQTFEQMIALIAEVAAKDPKKLDGLMKGALSQLNAMKSSLLKLAS